MKTRKIEKEINWYNRLRDTIDVLGAGDIYAMNKFRVSPKDKQVKMMNDMRCIIDEPKKSIVWNLACSMLGNDFEEEVLNVYHYGSMLVRIQNARA